MARSRDLRARFRPGRPAAALHRGDDLAPRDPARTPRTTRAPPPRWAERVLRHGLDPGGRELPLGQRPIFATSTARQPSSARSVAGERVVLALAARQYRSTARRPTSRAPSRLTSYTSSSRAWPKCSSTWPPPRVATATRAESDAGTPATRRSAASRSRARDGPRAGPPRRAARHGLPRVARRPGRELRERELREAVLAEPAHRVGAALAAVAHEPRVDLAGAPARARAPRRSARAGRSGRSACRAPARR